jgi:putative ABC transport system permease protein
MWKNYLTIASRNLFRQKAYSFVNIAGLAIGMACCILIMLWVQYQFSYDGFHQNIESLYWVPVWETHDGAMSTSYQAPPALGPALKEEYPEIVDAARVLRCGSQFVRYGEQQTAEDVRAVDPTFLQMFTFPLIEGDPLTALSEPRSMVVSEDIARKYFGADEAVGKTLTMTINAPYDFVVTGVMKKLPSNSTLEPQILIPLSFAGELEGREWIGTWTNLQFYTYAQLQEGVDYTEVNKKIAGRIKQSVPGCSDVPYLIPFSGIHLVLPSGSGNPMGQVILFSIVAGIILVIASINFVNLMTARACKRTKEIGMRKVSGASRSDLVKQFYFESLLHAAMAGVLAFALVELLLPVVRSLTGSPITLDFVHNPIIPLGWIAIIILTGILAGTYPALLLSAFRPANILKGAQAVGSKRSILRQALVVIQFAASMILILVTIGIYRQHGFLENRNLGFNKEQVIVLPLTDKMNFDLLKGELARNPGIQCVTSATSSLSGIYQNGTGFTWQGKDPQLDPEVSILGTSPDYLETFQIQMADGQFFSDELSGGTKDKIVINEAFAKLLGGESVIGRTISIDSYNFTVNGVTKDFYFKPLTRAVGPLMMFYKWKFGRGTPSWTVYARISPNNVEGTLAYIRSVWKNYGSGSPFEYHFLADEFEDMYSDFERLGSILLYFAGLAIIISGLGLFGLASYASEQRTKEIGVRKVLGSSTKGIVWLLTKEFLVLISLANCIAIPVAYLALQSWLQQYPYREDMNALMFLLPVIGLVAVAFVSVGFQAIKAANANPVESLKYE